MHTNGPIILAKFRRGNFVRKFKTDQSPKICPLEDFVPFRPRNRILKV